MICNNFIYCLHLDASECSKSLLKKKKKSPGYCCIKNLKAIPQCHHHCLCMVQRFLVAHSAVFGKKLCASDCSGSLPHSTWGPCTVFIVHLFLNTSRGPKILFLPANLTIASRVRAAINFSIINVQLPQLCTRFQGVSAQRSFEKSGMKDIGESDFILKKENNLFLIKCTTQNIFRVFAYSKVSACRNGRSLC